MRGFNENFEAATCYVDARTRAIHHWVTNGDQESFWLRAPAVLAEEAISICQDDLALKLRAIGIGMRSLYYSEAKMIEGWVPTICSCRTETDLNEMRSAFGLPTLRDARLKQTVLQPPELPKRNSRRTFADDSRESRGWQASMF